MGITGEIRGKEGKGKHEILYGGRPRGPGRRVRPERSARGIPNVLNGVPCTFMLLVVFKPYIIT